MRVGVRRGRKPGRWGQADSVTLRPRHPSAGDCAHGFTNPRPCGGNGDRPSLRAHGRIKRIAHADRVWPAPPPLSFSSNDDAKTHQPSSQWVCPSALGSRPSVTGAAHPTVRAVTRGALLLGGHLPAPLGHSCVRAGRTRGSVPASLRLATAGHRRRCGPGCPATQTRGHLAHLRKPQEVTSRTPLGLVWARPSRLMAFGAESAPRGFRPRVGAGLGRCLTRPRSQKSLQSRGHVSVDRGLRRSARGPLGRPEWDFVRTRGDAVQGVEGSLPAPLAGWPGVDGVTLPCLAVWRFLLFRL